MSRVHTCVNCRNSVGLDGDANHFTVSLGQHRGRYTVCYACWLLEPLPAARAVLNAALRRERGVITTVELEQAEENLRRVLRRNPAVRRMHRIQYEQ